MSEKMKNSIENLRGIIVPLVTPLCDPDTIDTPAVGKLINKVIDGKVDAVFILGTTGEGPALSLSCQHRMIDASVKAVAGRVPLLVGISGASAAETIELGRYALGAKADALVAALPCYIPPDPGEIEDYYNALAAEFPGRIFIYNMPGMTKVDISPELALKLLENDGIAGYKDSSGNMENFRRIAAGTSKPVFMGPEHLTARAMSVGGAGGVNGGANVRPELFASLVAAVDSKDEEKIAEICREIDKLQKIYGSPVTSSSVIRGLKYTLAEEGIIKNITAFPLRALEKSPLA